MPRLALALAALCIPTTVTAQSIAIDEYRPALDSRGYLTLNASQVLGHGEMSFGLGSLQWGHKLLSGDAYSVDDMVTATLVGAVGLRVGPVPLEIGVSLPLSIVSGTVDGQGVGDLGLHAKTRVARSGRFGLGVIASVFIPTGASRDAFLGESATTPQVMGVADATFGRLRVAVNGGVRLRRTTTFMDMTASTTLPIGAGAAYALVPDKVEIIGEVFGAFDQPLEALGGVKVYLAKSSYLSLGAGRGLMPDEVGNPDFRGVIGIVFEPRPAQRVAMHVPDERVAEAPPLAADDGMGDRDNDGIFDRDDKCPDDMESYNGWQDEDGCPDEEPANRELVIEKESELVTLEPIEFEFDKAVLRRTAYPILDAVVQALRDNPDLSLIEVQGHTDEQGNDAYNLDLSNRRAATVMRYLVDSGIPEARLTAKGYGETLPVDPRHTQAAYVLNRRVAFVIKQRD